MILAFQLAWAYILLEPIPEVLYLILLPITSTCSSTGNITSLNLPACCCCRAQVLVSGVTMTMMMPCGTLGMQLDSRSAVLHAYVSNSAQRCAPC